MRRRRLVLAVAVAALAWFAVVLARSVQDRAAGAANGSGASWLVRSDGSSTFAPGACRGFAPTTRWNGRTVFLDAGHGGPDPGAAGAAGGVQVFEEDLTLAIARRAVAKLRGAGYRVVLSRGADQSVARLRPTDLRGDTLTAKGVKRDLEARNACANAARADALVSIHLNSFSDSSVGGTQTLYNVKRTFSARSRTLAKLLQGSMLASMTSAGIGSSDRGVASDAGAGADALTPEAAAYGQLIQLGPAAPPWFRRPTRMPGALVEPLFVTSTDQAVAATQPSGQDAVAAGIARGVVRFLS